jgi:hypothetical protein
MPFVTDDLRRARISLEQFRSSAVSPHHERYSFPFFSGTYFAYRKIDVMRVVAVAKAVSGNNSPSYLDVGCGYGDFLKKVREFLPGAQGLEKDAGIFYGLGMEKPEHITIADAHWIGRKYDAIFVGWMEPGQDFRDSVAKNTDVVITTLDQGISLAAEFDGHGFERVAWWRTPSWEDVNVEMMNKYYTPQMPDSKRAELARLRGAHNLWYVYAKPAMAGIVRATLEHRVGVEDSNDRYDFEGVLDELGFGYLQKLETAGGQLWRVHWN